MKRFPRVLGGGEDAAAQLARLGHSERPLLFPASGNTGGSTMRLPLPNTIFGGVPTRSGSLVVTLSQGNFEFRLIPEHFRTLVLERLRFPVEARCECGMLLDSLGEGCVHPFGKAEEESSDPRENLAKGVQGGWKPQ